MEIVIILFIILLQLYLAWQTYQKIKELQSVFESERDIEIVTGDIPVSLVRSGDLETVKKYILSEEEVHHDEPTIEIALVSVFVYNDLEDDIITNINGYLLKNKGAVADYHLLKDIVDRHIDSLDEEINNSMPAPLYLGLAATMLGIVFGLMNMPGFDATDFNPDVLMPLLNGVKVAMTASVCGLLLTTILSIWFYKRAKSKTERNKNNFLSFLQINLLPELVRTETSGISALNDRLKRFGSVLSPTIKDLSQVVERSLQAVSIQERTINKVENLDATKLAKANASIFQELSQMMDSFKEFATYYQELNRSMIQTVELTSNLKELVSRTVEVETIAKGIDTTLTQNKELNQFLAQHFIDIKSREAALQHVVDSSSRTLGESLEVMKDTVRNKMQEVQGVTIEMEPKLKHAFDSSIRAIDHMTKEQVSQIEQAFEKSKPKFEKLEKLDKIEEGINTLAVQGARGAEKQDQFLLAIQELTSVLKQEVTQKNESSGNDALLAELRSINQRLANNSNDRKKNNSEGKARGRRGNKEKGSLEQAFIKGIKAIKSKSAFLLGIKTMGAVGFTGAAVYLIKTLLNLSSTL